MKKKIAIGLVLLVTICSIMYSEEKNYNVSVTCRVCEQTTDITVTAETATEAEEKAKSKIVLRHTKSSCRSNRYLSAIASLERQISGN